MYFTYRLSRTELFGKLLAETQFLFVFCIRSGRPSAGSWGRKDLNERKHRTGSRWFTMFTWAIIQWILPGQIPSTCRRPGICSKNKWKLAKLVGTWGTSWSRVLSADVGTVYVAAQLSSPCLVKMKTYMSTRFMQLFADDVTNPTACTCDQCSFILETVFGQAYYRAPRLLKQCPDKMEIFSLK